MYTFSGLGAVFADLRFDFLFFVGRRCGEIFLVRS